MDAKTSSRSIYYLRITLQNSKPLIWRDVLVPSKLTLEDLHYVIQAVMGWENRHLHQFIAERVIYTEGGNDSDSDEYDRNEKKYTVSQLLPKEKNSMLYEYDLGDSWTHKIELKKILPASKDTEVYHPPRCIKGKRACPPEACGGIWGYTDMLEMLQQTGNSESDETDEIFNPDYFSIDAVNRKLEKFVSLTPL